jgi:hypothetical protein
MPLLACALGPIEGYASSAELAVAEAWWAEALPAWPRWVTELQSAGIQEHRTRLLATVKGHPTPLIPRTKRRGCAPHIRGRDQVEALELAPAVAIEVYACVTCLYTAAAMDVASSGPVMAGAPLSACFYSETTLVAESASAAVVATAEGAEHAAPEHVQTRDVHEAAGTASTDQPATPAYDEHGSDASLTS